MTLEPVLYTFTDQAIDKQCPKCLHWIVADASGNGKWGLFDAVNRFEGRIHMCPSKEERRR